MDSYSSRSSWSGVCVIDGVMCNRMCCSELADEVLHSSATWYMSTQLWIGGIKSVRCVPVCGLCCILVVVWCRTFPHWNLPLLLELWGCCCDVSGMWHVVELGGQYSWWIYIPLEVPWCSVGLIDCVGYIRCVVLCCRRLLCIVEATKCVITQLLVPGGSNEPWMCGVVL